MTPQYRCSHLGVVTDPLWWRHSARLEKTSIGDNCEMTDWWLVSPRSWAKSIKSRGELGCGWMTLTEIIHMECWQKTYMKVSRLHCIVCCIKYRRLLGQKWWALWELFFAVYFTLFNLNLHTGCSKAWVGIYIYHKVWDENSYIFLNFNDAAAWVWEWLIHAGIKVNLR